MRLFNDHAESRSISGWMERTSQRTERSEVTLWAAILLALAGGGLIGWGARGYLDSHPRHESLDPRLLRDEKALLDTARPQPEPPAAASSRPRPVPSIPELTSFIRDRVGEVWIAHDSDLASLRAYLRSERVVLKRAFPEDKELSNALDLLHARLSGKVEPVIDAASASLHQMAYWARWDLAPYLLSSEDQELRRASSIVSLIPRYMADGQYWVVLDLLYQLPPLCTQAQLCSTVEVWIEKLEPRVAIGIRRELQKKHGRPSK